MTPRPSPRAADSADRPVAWVLAVVGGGLTALGGLVTVAGALSRGQEVAPILLFGGLLTLGFGVPWLFGAAAILRGSRAGYWGLATTGLVALALLLLAFRSRAAPVALLPFLVGVGPAVLAARRLGAPASFPAAPSEPRSLVRSLGLGATILGALFGLMGLVSLSFGRLGPPVPSESGDEWRRFMFGGGGPLLGGIVLVTGGVVAMLGMRWGAMLALVGLLLVAAPYTLFAGPFGPILLIGGGLLAARTIAAATRA